MKTFSIKLSLRVSATEAAEARRVTIMNSVSRSLVIILTLGLSETNQVNEKMFAESFS